MRNRILCLMVCLLLTGAGAFGGSFTDNFSTTSTTGFTLNGSGVLPDTSSWTPEITNGVLVLTTNVNSLGGSIVLDDLDGGAAIDGFTANFQIQFGPGSGNPADGASFVFGPDLSSTVIWNEEAQGPFPNSLAVEFDIYDNGGGDGTSVDVRLFNNEISHILVPKSTFITGTLKNVSITLNPNATITVVYDGVKYADNVYLPGWGATPGLFGVSARTGGENAVMALDNFSVTTHVAPITPLAPSVTSNPTNITVNEGKPVSFSATYGGSAPFSFQWTENGTPINGGTNPAVTIPRAHFSDNNAQIRVTVSNVTGSAVSGPATLTVIKDITPPTITHVEGSAFFNQLTVTFSEPVDATTAGNVANYNIPGLAITAATPNPVNDSLVTLTTAVQTPGATYTLTVNNVRDQATTPNTIAANSHITFPAYVIAKGIVKGEFYNNLGALGQQGLDNLLADPRYLAGAPDVTGYFINFDAAESYLAGSTVLNYAASVTGWFIPPTNGNYNFFIRSDDSSELFLSTDATPANLSASPICEEFGCCNSFKEPGAFQTTAAPIALLGGNKYYFQAILAQGGGGDYVQVAVRADTDTTPAANLKPLSGSLIAVALSPAGSSLAITQQPADQNAIAGRTTVNFQVGATATSVLGTTILYQWQRGGTDIPGATGSTYTISPVLADNNAIFDCVVTVPGQTATTRSATLTVIANTFPPNATVGAISRPSGAVDVGVSFDELVDLSTIVPGNFGLSSGAVTNVSIATNTFMTYRGAVVEGNGLAPGTGATLHISGVKDLLGNTLNTNINFTVSKTVGWAESGIPIAPGQVVPVGNNGFDILNGGRQAWGNYDEVTMAYVVKTNDFDVQVEVIYAEPSSKWARIALAARNSLDIGTDSTTGMQAYAHTQVDPATDLADTGFQVVPGDPNGPNNSGSNNSHEQNARLGAFAQTTGWGNPGAAPHYPHAWMRLSRSGTTIHGYRSDDGMNWIDQGTTVLTDQTNVMYVGPYECVESGNIFSNAGIGNSTFDPNYNRLYLAQFRNFTDVPHVSIAPGPGSSKIVTFVGALQSAASVAGPYVDVVGASSPYTIPAGPAQVFYRARAQ